MRERQLPPDRHLAPDRIELRGLRFLGCHGALPEEAVRAQPFEVDLDLFTDLSPAGASDALDSTVDYGALCEVVRIVIEGTQATLIEHLAEQVARRALDVAGARADSVVVAVRKLRPPVPYQMASAGVRIRRRAVSTGTEGANGLSTVAGPEPPGAFGDEG